MDAQQDQAKPKRKRRTLLIIAAVGALLTCICVGVLIATPTEEDESTAVVTEAENTSTLAQTNTPTPTTIPALTGTPVPTATTVQFVSGGLGLTSSGWERLYGTGASTDLGAVKYADTYEVYFQDSKAWHIEREWGEETRVGLTEARDECRQLIPADAVLVRTYSPDGMPELVVDLYMSASLIEQFGAQDSLWIGGEPGNFVLVYGVSEGAVGRMVAGLGDNP